ncbi:hypothetical protein ACLOJK_010555 [Asimina triloba]
MPTCTSREDERSGNMAFRRSDLVNVVCRHTSPVYLLACGAFVQSSLSLRETARERATGAVRMQQQGVKGQLFNEWGTSIPPSPHQHVSGPQDQEGRQKALRPPVSHFQQIALASTTYDYKNHLNNLVDIITSNVAKRLDISDISVLLSLVPCHMPSIMKKTVGNRVLAKTHPSLLLSTKLLGKSLSSPIAGGINGGF